MTMANYKTRVSLLAISLVFALTALVALSPAKAGATYQPQSICGEGYELLDKYEYDDGQYKKDGTSGNNVTVTGNGTSGTFSVVNQKKLVYAVKIESDDKSKVDSYPAGVSSGTFNNAGLVKNGYTQKIEEIAFCGKDAYYLQIDKKWAGDKVDTTKVNVVINAGNVQWSTGGKPVLVEPGKKLYPITETVTGLPENCTYTTDIPKYYTPFQVNGDNYRNIAVDNGPRIDTLTVTNTVTCEDEGEVLGTTTATTTPATTVASLPNTGSKVAAVAAILTTMTAGAVMFSTTLRSALVKFTK